MGIKDAELKAIRAKEMIVLKTQKGMTNKEIGAAMGLHPDTVQRVLTQAKRAGLFVQYDDRVLQDIVPKAIEALKMALEDGDGELAIKVLNNTIWATQKEGQSKSNGASAPQQGSEDQDLSTYIAQIRAKAQLEEETTDGEIVESNAKRVMGLLGEATEATTASTTDDPVGE